MYWDSHGRRLTPLRAVSFLAFVFITLRPVLAAEPRATNCVLLAAEGKVEVSRKGAAQWQRAQTNQALAVGDLLRTGSRSRATLRWSDESITRVNELTSMEIQAPHKAGASPQLDLRSGASYFFSRERPDSIGFRTPVASGAIRGTEFNLAVAEDGRTVLTLLEGEVELRNDRGEVALKSGEQGVVEGGQAPRKTAVVDAINVIQWALYYPMVIDPDELQLTDQERDALKPSLEPYRQGDLLAALAAYPEDRKPGSQAERILAAALSLAVGQVERAQAALKEVKSPLATALNELIATVKNQEVALAAPTTSSEWMARSYYHQSKSQLEEALKAARAATEKSPRFGAAWIRVAELEFGFGRTKDALAALEKGLELSPRNPHGLVLKGFVLAARDKRDAALKSFDDAIAIDGGLGTAWLGRGLVKIRKGDSREGRDDLQVAATLEPQRAVYRSYLGKAYQQTWDHERANKELDLAKKLDPNDPTAWLYSALLNEQGNRVNDAVHDLEKSKDLNENRSIFRSRLLLDQDQAVRSANLAAIYKDAGMFEYAVQEAARAVNHDYANYSAHLFLANCYDYLRDRRQFNLRFETPWFSEWLIANLLAPPGAGALSQNVSQQEYSRLFDSDHLGLFSRTDYFSNGDWFQSGSQYGNVGKTGYSLDASYRSENGWRANNDLEAVNFAARLKHQITPEDSVFFQVSYFDVETGDIGQYFDQSQASRNLRVTEKQEPNLIAGYHRRWSPGSHTLFLAGRFDDTLTLQDPNPLLPYLQTFVFQDQLGNLITNQSLSTLSDMSLDYESRLEAYSAELQHIWQLHPHTIIVGGRYQTGSSETETALDRPAIPSPIPGFPGTPAVRIRQDVDTELHRVSIYGYEQWQLLESLRLTAGVSYDRLEYPENIDTSPIIDDETSKDQFSPKAGIVWQPFGDTYIRGAYTRSLGGVFFDTSIRLEPTQVAGINQAFRSLIPESVVGLVPGTRFETWGAGINQRLKSGLYLDVFGEILESDAQRTVGLIANDPAVQPPAANEPSATEQSLDYRERSLVVAANQLLGRDFAVGARYRLTAADLDSSFGRLSPNVAPGLEQNVSATMQQLLLAAIFNHPSGAFAQVNGIWTEQDNYDYPGRLPGDHFWHLNALVGYRFFRRHGEVAVGLLNIFDRDYQLNPLTLYSELPRERTFVASLKFYF
jgi:tetratricopeptide (TPR) repeat protein